MSGEMDLQTLFQTMTATLKDGLYVFATFESDVPEVLSIMRFEEAEGTTLILLKSDADVAGITYEFPCRMITLNVHSALDAVGFLAHIATKLAAQNMGVNPVAGFYHDHLFIPDGRERDAMATLEQIAKDA
ncbi:MAG: ACT domain-containing protein [Planktomarina sp.]